MENINRRDYFGKSGIYKIQSILDGKCYIGSSKNLYRRINKHINDLKYNRHHSKKLQNFYNKYGKDFLFIEIIELCNINLLENRENLYRKKYDSVKNGFDNLEFSYNPKGLTWNKEQKENLKIIWKEKLIEKYKDKLLNNLELARISKIENPIKIDWWIGRKHKESSKNKMSKSAIKRGINYEKCIIQYNKNMEFIAEYSNARVAQNKTNISYQNISKCCNFKRNTAGGYIWRFNN